MGPYALTDLLPKITPFVNNFGVLYINTSLSNYNLTTLLNQTVKSLVPNLPSKVKIPLIFNFFYSLIIRIESYGGSCLICSTYI